MVLSEMYVCDHCNEGFDDDDGNRYWCENCHEAFDICDECRQHSGRCREPMCPRCKQPMEFERRCR